MISVLTKNIFSRAIMALAGGLLGLVVMATMPASASAFERPDPCYVDHDHRSHQADYYDYYEQDDYYRAGPYRGSSSFSITFGSRGYDDYNRRTGRYGNARGDYDRGYNGRSDYDRGRRGGSKIVRKESFDTRQRAQIILTEELIYGRRGNALICTVTARGPDARYIPYERLSRVANRNCSRNARINIVA